MIKRVIYTVLLGDYDQLRCSIRSAGFDHYIITDNADLVCDGWETVVVKANRDILKQSRELKLLVHQYIEAELYIYIDANYEIVSDLNPFVQRYFFGGFTAVRHPGRDCLYQEAAKLLETGKAARGAVENQISAYASEGMPHNFGLFANGFFIRDRSFDKFFEAWYAEIGNHCHRDQLSLPYLIWRDKPTVTVLDWHLKDVYLALHPHKNGSILMETPRIWYFVPGCGKKDLGSAINRHCSIVPNDDDWILIRDNDTAFLHPYINRQLEDIITKHGGEFDLLSCYTNRLGLSHQLPYGLMPETDLLKLREIAEKHYAEQYDEVIPSDKPTAGLFMLFQKKTWREHPFEPGLASNGDFIDYRFSNGLLQKGFRIGICTGIFLLHYYRLHQTNPREHAHLDA